MHIELQNKFTPLQNLPDSLPLHSELSRNIRKISSTKHPSSQKNTKKKYNTKPQQTNAAPLASQAATSPHIPFSEDCLRSFKQLIDTLGGYSKNTIITSGIGTLFPSIPMHVLTAANVLYIAVTEKKHIDIAALQALGLASQYLPDNINIISPVACYIRDTISHWTEDSVLHASLEETQKSVSPHLVTALAVSVIVAKYWLANDKNAAPRRPYLKMPAVLADIVLRANNYWAALGNMAQKQSPMQDSALNHEVTSVLKPTIEIDTSIETMQPFHGVPVMKKFLSNSTVVPEALTKATVSNKPVTSPIKEASIPLTDKIHAFAVDKQQQLNGLSTLLYCQTQKTETQQRADQNIITYSHFNTQCEAILSPSLLPPIECKNEQALTASVLYDLISSTPHPHQHETKTDVTKNSVNPRETGVVDFLYEKLVDFLIGVDNGLTFPGADAAPVSAQPVTSLPTNFTQEELNLIDSMKYGVSPEEANYAFKNSNPAIYGEGEVIVFIITSDTAISTVNIAGRCVPLTTQSVPGHGNRLAVTDKNGTVHPLGWSHSRGWYLDKNRTYSPVDHLIAKNDAVTRGLQERGKLNSGIDISKERLLGTVSNVFTFRNDGQEQINIARDILSATDSYGGEKNDPLSLSTAKAVNRQWILNNLFDDTLSGYIRKQFAGQLGMTTDQLRDMLSLDNLRMVIDQYNIPQASKASFNHQINSSIRDEIPFLSHLKNDSQLNSMSVTDYEFASLYAGSKWIFDMKGNEGLKAFNRTEIAQIGDNIWTLSTENGVTADLLPYLELPALLNAARAAPADSVINSLNATVALAEDRKNIEQHRQETLEHYEKYKKSVNEWSRKGRLADKIMVECPDILVKAGKRGKDHTQGWHNLHERYMDGIEKPCDGAPDSLADEFARVTKKVADDFKPLDRVLLNGSLGKANTTDVNYIFLPETTIYPVDFKLRGYGAKGGHLPNFYDKRIQLNSTHLFATKHKGEERIYALKSDKEGTMGGYKLIRLDRNIKDYIKAGVLAADFSKGYSVSDSGHILKFNGTQYTLDVITDTENPIGKGITPLVEYVVNKNSDAIYDTLYKLGNDKTYNQIVGRGILHLTPLYDCVTELNEADYDKAIGSCLMDAISFIPLIGQVGKSTGLGKGLIEGSMALKETGSLSTAGRTMLSEIRLPKISELNKLGKDALELLDPGVLNAGKGVGKGVVWLGEKIGGRLKNLKMTKLSDKVADITKAVGNAKQVGESKMLRLMDADIYLPVKKTGTAEGSDIYHAVNPHTGEPFGKKYKIYAGELVDAKFISPIVGGKYAGNNIPIGLQGDVNKFRQYIHDLKGNLCAVPTARVKRQVCEPLSLTKLALDRVLEYATINELSVLAKNLDFRGAVLKAVNNVAKTGTERADSLIKAIIDKANASDNSDLISIITSTSNIEIRSALYRRLQKFNLGEMAITSPKIIGGHQFAGPSSPGDLVFTAIDTDNGIRRLNISAHGRAGLVEIDHGVTVSADGLYAKLRTEGILDQQFDEIRMLTCHSADVTQNGEIMAQRLAQLTGKPVEGYLGVMTAILSMDYGTGVKIPARHMLNNAYITGGIKGANEFITRNAPYLVVGPSPYVSNNFALKFQPK